MNKFYKNPTPSGNVPTLVKTESLICIEKGWGRQRDNLGEYFAYHSDNIESPINIETVKLLFFAKGKRLSRHYHVKKLEYFVLVSGCLKIEIWNSQGEHHEFTMEPLDRIVIKPGTQHRMTGIKEENILLEISTLDESEDSFRIEKGD